MGAMEWGVTGGSVHPAAGESGDEASRRTGTGQFLDTSSMGAMERGEPRARTEDAVLL